MPELVLTVEQEAEAQRLAQVLGQKAQDEALHMARILVSKPDAQLLGASEFAIRDRAHAFASPALQPGTATATGRPVLT